MKAEATTSFTDRREAGRFLAEQLLDYADRPDVLVLGLPRGGVPVAFEVAKRLHAPLDVFLVRKLGVPGAEELAFGAVASGGVRVLNDDVIRSMRIKPDVIEAVTARESEELRHREQAYRGGLVGPHIAGRTVILIDDGLATGASMRAAVTALRSERPARLIVAAPVGSRQACKEFAEEVDEAVCGMMPEPFYGVGRWYEDFSPTDDEEVHELLARARRPAAPAAGDAASAGDEREG